MPTTQAIARKQVLFKPALLSLSLLTILTGAVIAPTLGSIAADFPAASATDIRLILTLPSIFIMLVSLLTGWLTQYFSKRMLLMIGLVIYLVSGVSGGFAPSIAILLIARSFLGMAVGLITPLSVSLITDFYVGEDRTQMMGFAQAARSMTGVLVTPLVGLIAVSNWRNIFWVYSLALPVMLAVWLILPEPKKPEVVKKSKTTTRGLPKAAWMFAGFMFLQRIAFYVMPTNLSVYLLENDIGGAGLSGLAISADTLASFAVGMFFSWLFKRQNRWMGMTSLILIGLGYLSLAAAQGPVLVFVAMALIGFGEGQMMPLLFLQTAQSVSAQQRTTAIALVSSMQFMGQFATPFALRIIAAVTGNQSFETMFVATSSILLVVVLIQIIVLVKRMQPAPEN
jgi:MFS family permease